MGFKIDFEKVHDHVSWEILDHPVESGKTMIFERWTYWLFMNFTLWLMLISILYYVRYKTEKIDILIYLLKN